MPDGQDPQGPGVPAPQALHTQYGGPAVDGQGRADCQSGQTGYPFSLTTDGRYKGGHTALDANTPGSAGGTFKARELGVSGTGDVP